MEIQCPSCHLAGKVNELELPPIGRDLTCPRCKKSFHVDKPAAPAANRALMNSCPACQYSTFTEEMFAVCPKCGMTAEDYQAVARRTREREQTARDQEALQRNFRNPDLVKPPAEELAVVSGRAPQPVEVTAWLCMLVGAALLLYGILGLQNYYARDWQAVLSEPVLVPVSKLSVFFRLGLIPWSAALAGIYMLWAAFEFHKLKKESLRRLFESAWGGVTVAIIYEAVDFGNWVRVSSGAPTVSYLAAGAASSLFWAALLGAPFAGLAWYLRSDGMSREFRKGSQLRYGNGPEPMR